MNVIPFCKLVPTASLSDFIHGKIQVLCLRSMVTDQTGASRSKEVRTDSVSNCSNRLMSMI